MRSNDEQVSWSTSNNKATATQTPSKVFFPAAFRFTVSLQQKRAKRQSSCSSFFPLVGHPTSPQSFTHKNKNNSKKHTQTNTQIHTQSCKESLSKRKKTQISLQSKSAPKINQSRLPSVFSHTSANGKLPKPLEFRPQSAKREEKNTERDIHTLPTQKSICSFLCTYSILLETLKIAPPVPPTPPSPPSQKKKKKKQIKNKKKKKNN